MLQNNLVLSNKEDCLSLKHNNIFFNDKTFYETNNEFVKKIKYIIPKEKINERI